MPWRPYGSNQSKGPPSLIQGTRPPCRWTAVRLIACSAPGMVLSTGRMCLLTKSRFWKLIWIGWPSLAHDEPAQMGRLDVPAQPFCRRIAPELRRTEGRADAVVLELDDADLVMRHAGHGRLVNPGNRDRHRNPPGPTPRSVGPEERNAGALVERVRAAPLAPPPEGRPAPAPRPVLIRSRRLSISGLLRAGGVTGPVNCQLVAPFTG